MIARVALALTLGTLLTSLTLLGCTAPAPAPPSPTETATAAYTASPEPPRPTSVPTAVRTAEPTGAPMPAAATAPKAEPKMGGILTLAMPSTGTEEHFDSTLFVDRTSALWWGNIYESLLARDVDTYQVVPRLAERWELSSDAKALTLTLRNGAKWHDMAPLNGRQFTAADVKWNLERIRDLSPIPPWASGLRSLVEVQTPDKATAKLVMKEPARDLVSLLANPGLMMYPKELFDIFGPKQRTLAIGTGPLLLQSYDPELGMKMVRNAAYYVKGLPRVDEVDIVVIKDKSERLAALRGGRVAYLEGLTQTDATDLIKSNPGLKAIAYKSATDGSAVSASGSQPGQSYWVVRPEFKDLRPMVDAPPAYFGETYRFAWVDE